MRSPSVEAQSAATPSHTVPSGELSSSLALQRGRFRVHPKVITTLGIGGSVNAGPDAQNGSQLCFLPGTGWQRVPISSVGDTAEMLASRSAERRGGKRSTLVGIARSAYGRPSGASLKGKTTCPDVFPSVTVSGPLENYVGVMSSINSTLIDSYAQESFHPNSVINGVDSGGLDNHGLPSVTKDWSSSSAEGRRILPERLFRLERRAYTSPIELRREIRNAADLTTRIKLRRLQDELEQKSRALRANPAQAPKNQLNSLFGGKANSSSPKPCERKHQVPLSARRSMKDENCPKWQR